MEKLSFAIIGAGRVGAVFAAGLRKCGYRLAGIASRTPASAAELAERFNVPWSVNPAEIAKRAEIVFIMTLDRCIGHVAEEIARQGGWHKDQYVYHASGALPADILAAAGQQGAFIGALHPLQSFAGGGNKDCLSGVCFAVDGGTDAICLAKDIVRDLGGYSFFVPQEKRALYHAAACIASNYLVVLMHYAVNLFQQLGLSAEKATTALMPLLQGTLDNLANKGTDKALTGPIARGDANTVAAHLTILAQSDPNTERLYRQLGLHTLLLVQKMDCLEWAKLYDLLRNNGEGKITKLYQDEECK
ncbi:Rossmann-like and DUF2520 domain-containing protein [Sporomusa acidovorans]|uniref:DUF2520 domain-containing protein n=1 Tax=Sporomusa acidovorans (strain ATCC 49682 / DSM 3132 / Mol) TaxID=1123286 RepID=A0ABZ3J9G1_SPOA4|nr:DUF2520 domain-containing protein [Sporomusa acidovorans]OZC19710.1 Rossmann-like domain protein [Sporomusa acidovorans DSM 3132]SDF81806.1 Predicted oxidoreductase, contains short-chain dehydrogenase (SDR) and DUF2520 domains [Sporomusa acidovorans]